MKLLTCAILLFFSALTPTTLLAQYCASAATSTADSDLDRVQLAGNSVTINNASVGACALYTDFTAVAAADLTQGISYTVNITQGTCGGNYTRYTNAWIDWNNDNDFADLGEMLGTGTTGNATANFVTAINFIVPGTAAIGTHRMRCIVQEGATAINPCASYTWGETEDYNVTVVAGTPMTITSASVTQLATGNISNCASNEQILKLTINTTGTIPLSLTQIQTNFSGTAAVGAFTTSKIYATGSTNSFSTTTLFGSAAVSASTYNINGSINLGTGANYFWLVYDLNNTGVATTTVDAIISQFTATAINYNSGTTPAVTTTNPGGNGTIVLCPSPGGIATGLQTWLRADMGTSGVASMTGWANQANGGTATNLNGNPALNITNTGYNYNYYIDFAAPVGTLDGGVATNRQCVLLNGYTGISGINYASLFFTFQLNDLTRLNTHCATVKGVTMSAPANGTWHGDANGATASILLEAYDITDFGTSAVAGTWQRNQANIASNSNHSSTKHILSAVCQTGGSTTLNAFLGGQDDQTPSSSFAGHTRDWKGPAAEIIGYTSALTATQRQRVDTYLAVKYGITLPNNYLSTTGSTIFTVAAPYNNNIIGIGRDDAEMLTQKQSHYDDDNTRMYISTLAAMNPANAGTFSNDVSYVISGDNNGVYCATVASCAEVPTGLTNCTLYSRIEREWKVTRTNMSQNYNMDVKLSSCGIPGSVNVSELRLLVDDDGNFANGGTQCYYNGDGTGIVFSYSNPTITISNISTTHIPNNTTRFITIASINYTTPLPVELLQFDATLASNERMVDLNWTTQSEFELDYFMVQKLSSDNEWVDMEKVEATGSSIVEKDYATVDPTPVLGMNYYRLQQVDENGNYEYSAVRSVSLKPGNELLVFPNPANASVTLSYKGIAKQEFTVYSEIGAVVVLNPTILSDDTITFSTAELANGIYFIRLNSDQLQHYKLVVQH